MTKHVLFIATRAPYGEMTGHKMGVRTYIQSLQGLGHKVIVAAFAIPGDESKHEDLGAETHYLLFPSKWEIASNIATHGLSGRLSVNECLYASKATRHVLKQIADQGAIDFVVADMVRTARYADRLGVPWLLDLPDLFSERYATVHASDNENVLGYLTQVIPPMARPMARWLFCRLMRREARMMARREVYWTARATSSSLRSIDETRRLQQRATGRVFCMPASVPIPSNPADRLNIRPMVAVFVGGLTFQPNLEALRTYAEQIIPQFEAQHIPPPLLQVIGSAPDHLRKGLQNPAIQFLGYVPDVNAMIRTAQVYFAPIVSGTGIKTKALEALACGLPLLALPHGVAGLHGEHERHYLRANDPSDFVRQYCRLDRDTGLAHAIGAAGRELAIRYYSLEAATEVLAQETAKVGL